jgi:hypothetical protein
MDPPNPTPKGKAYIPKPGDTVIVKGVIITLTVVAVDGDKKTATVAARTIPSISYAVPWSELTRVE